MADPATRKRIADARTGATTETAAPPAATPAVSEYAEPDVQHRILEPTPEFVSIGGKETKLYHLAAKHSKKLCGLAVMVMQDAQWQPVPDSSPDSQALGALLRISAVLNNKYGDDFHPLLVHATRPAGEISHAQAIAQSAALEEQLTYQETGKAWLTLLAMNNVFEMLGLTPDAPKKKHK